MVILVLAPCLVALERARLQTLAVRLAAGAMAHLAAPAARALAGAAPDRETFLDLARSQGVAGAWSGRPPGRRLVALAGHHHELETLPEPGEEPTLVRGRAPDDAPWLVVSFPPSAGLTQPVVLARSFRKERLELATGQGFSAVAVVYTMAVLFVALHFVVRRAGAELARQRDALATYARQLEQVQDHLERTSRLAQLGELSASVAHEVKNPLAAISAGLQVVRRRAKDPGLVEDLARIEEAVQRLDRTVTGMLRFSGRGGAPGTRVGLASVAEKVLILLRKPTKDRGLLLVERYPGRPVEVLGDPVQLEQVVLNLILNAEQASRPGGSIEVEVEQQGGRGWVRVLDRGVGLGEADPETHFQAFRDREPGRGAGLGLSISRRIARAHGGEVRLAPREGGGAVASLELPLAPEGGP